MIFTVKTRRFLFILAAILLGLAAVYHFIEIFDKKSASPVWRHILFIAINFFCVYGFLKRPAFFVYFIALLLIQQYYSHGSYLLKIWNEQHRIHWISLFDLLLLPLGLVCLVEDRKLKKSATSGINDESSA